MAFPAALGALAPTLVGGALSLFGGNKAADAQVEAARIAAEASRFKPYDVSLPGGSATFGEGKVTGALSPQLQALQQQLYGGAQGAFGGGAGLSPDQLAMQQQLQQSASGQLGAFGSFDPAQAARQQYERLQAISQPAEQRQQEATTAQLFKRGILGATAGKNVLESEATARNMRDLARESQAFGQAQDVQGAMLQRALASQQGALGLGMFGQDLQSQQLQQGLAQLQAGQGLDQSALAAIQQGAGIGGQATQGSQFGAQFPWQAGLNRSDATAAFWSSLGQGIGGMNFNKMFSPGQPAGGTNIGGIGARSTFANPAFNVG